MASSSRNGSKKVYSFLGPVGTFTELALAQVKAAKGAVHKPVSSVTEAIDDVLTGAATRAIVPVENSIEGGVSATLDALANSENIRIFGEYLVPVTFNLVARPGTKLADVRTIATHPVAYAQCRGWLAANLPQHAHLPATSTAAAASALLNSDYADAAIAAADVTLVRPDLRSAADAVRLARQTMRTIRGNLFWAFAYNVVLLPLAALGYLNPILSGLAMACSSLFVLGNSLRLRRFRAS